MDQPGHDPVLTLSLVTRIPLVAVAAALGLAAGAPAQQTAAAAPRDTVAALAPAPDQGRGIEAELRTALFELASDRPLAALDRLRWLDSARDVFAGAADSARARADLRFLLAESYYRLGMGPQFRVTANALTAVPDGARYASLLNAQLMLDAYRRADFAAVRSLATRQPGGDRGLAQLLYGLAAYQSRDWTTARGAFGAARAAGGVYAPYAQYMDALTVLAGDTTHAAQALETLQPLTSVATGPFGDQVRLTAAELAYQSGQYDAAASYAQGVSPTSGLAPQAVLTRAWALYRAGKSDDAGAAFADFAKRFPSLPQRDAARLMVGQVMLESGRSADAGRYFDAVADSVASDLTLLQSRATAALDAGARALVQSRAAALAFLSDARDGKSLALPDDANADGATILAAFTGAEAPPARTGPEPVTVADVETRADSLSPALGPEFPRRVLYMPASSPAVGASYADRAQELASADVAVVLARYRVKEQLDAQVMVIASLEDMQKLIGTSRDDLASGARTLAALQDSLAGMATALERARGRIRTMLSSQAANTRAMAMQNAHTIDSLRAALGPDATPDEMAALGLEAQTAATYARLADEVSQQLDPVIARQPAFALRDSLTARLARAHALHDQVEAVLASDDAIATQQLQTLRTVESDRVRAMRAALATAESQRAAAEGQLIALVDGELKTRATALVAALQHDRESADYGSASAAFFRATESGTSNVPAASTASPPASSSPR